MKRRQFAKLAGLGAAAGWSISLPGQTGTRTQLPERGAFSLLPAQDWEYGMIAGGGTLGAMVFGEPLDETVILNHAQLFMPWEKPLPSVASASHLTEIRRLNAEGKYGEAVDLFMTLAAREGITSLRWTDPLIPAFDLRVRMSSQGPIRNYARSVDYQTGVVTVRWEDGRGEVVRKLFVSRPANVLVLSIRGGADCRLALEQRPLTPKTGMGSDTERFTTGIKDIETAAEPGWLSYLSTFKRPYEGSLQAYQGVARVIVKGGTASPGAKEIAIANAEEVLVLVQIGLTRDATLRPGAALKRQLSALPGDFETLLRPHASVHGSIFKRTRLDLGGGADRGLPTEELLARSKSGTIPGALLEREFDAGRYAILGSTGKWPPTLQGIWNGTWAPGWSSDFTQNGNVQTAIAGMLSGNMGELMLSYFDYLEMLLPQMRASNRRMYGCRGFHIPTRTSTHGFNNHFMAEYPMPFWTAGAAWAAHFYYDYWLYTGDRKFLAARAIPFMKETAEFYEDFLIEGPDGRYLFSPSYSSENTPTNQKSAGTVNATMDISLAKELLTNLIDACRVLDIESEDVARWQKMLAKMPDYQIGPDGALKEWAHPDFQDNYAHRHASHLYAAYDGLAPDVAASPVLQKAFARAIELRMLERRKQNIGIMCFGLVQVGLAAASLRDSATAYQIVEWLATRGWNSATNPWHHPGYLFGVDICGGMPELIVKMLLYTQAGLLDLLPALPAAWPSGRIEGLPCRGQMLVKSLAWDRSGIQLTLRSSRNQRVRLRAPRSIVTLTEASGHARIEPADGNDSRYITIPAGRDLSFAIRLGEA